MEDIERPAGQRVATARTSQACQRCRSLKTRCLPSERPGTCQRCLTSKRECAWAETPQRAKRARGPSRISQVEQKIDGIVASLTTSNSAGPTTTAAQTASSPKKRATETERPLAPGSWLPFPSSFASKHPSLSNATEETRRDAEPTRQFLDQLREIHSFGDDHEMHHPPNIQFPTPHRIEPTIENDKIDYLLSSGEADALLNEYRLMSPSFPFMPLSPATSAQSLFDAKPMLFLAVITVASRKDHQRQLSLDELYRTELANRTIIRPRRTLSLLQSVLVYLSRYHFVFSHKTQQIYFMQQLAIGLAIDLGLHQRSTRPLMEFPGRAQPQPPSAEERRERQRTFLGCYFLSSTIAGGMQKPNLLKYTDYMSECARALGLDRECASDAAIPHYIALRRLDDHIHDAFYTEEMVDLPITDSRILMNMRFFETQLEEWKRENQGEDYQRELEFSLCFTEMQLHSIGLRTPAVSMQTSSVDSTRLNALLATLEAGKRFLDALLTFPLSEYHLISFPEWMRVPYVVITVARLCIPNDDYTASQWDVKAAQDRVRLDLYLESLCYRMHSLTTYDKVEQPHHDFWWAMRMIMELTKKWFVRKITPKKSASTQPTPNEIPTPEASRGSTQGAAETASLATPGGASEFTNSITGDAGFTMNTNSSRDDPFAFMRDMDFDMDKFFDIGLWGDESYVGMGFGSRSF